MFAQSPQQKFCGAFTKATASPSRARRRIGIFLFVSFLFLCLYWQKEKAEFFLTPYNIVLTSMFFFSSFLAKEKKNQKEKTRFVRIGEFRSLRRATRAIRPLTRTHCRGGLPSALCEHSAPNNNLAHKKGAMLLMSQPHTYFKKILLQA